MEDRDRVAAAWLEAADDLGVRVETGGGLSDHEGRRYDFVVVLPDFGGPGGAAVLVDRPDSVHMVRLRRLAKSHGVFLSFVRDGYESYDRDLFIVTLNDWQWHGVGDPPAWYIGTPWTT